MPKTKSKKKRAGSSRLPLLSAEQRAGLVKPPPNFEEVTESLATRLTRLKKRVPTKIRPAELVRLLAKAKRARAREERVETQITERLLPLKDARLLAEDAAWRAALRVWHAIKFGSEDDPALMEHFEFFRQALPRGRGARAPAEEEPTISERPGKPAVAGG